MVSAYSDVLASCVPSNLLLLSVLTDQIAWSFLSEYSTVPGSRNFMATRVGMNELCQISRLIRDADQLGHFSPQRRQ